MKHRKGYFKGNPQKYFITAYSSLRKVSEPVNNKIISKELGISNSTLYRIKAGGKPSKATNKKLQEFWSKEYIYAGRLNKQGSLFFKTVEHIRKNQKGKKLKEVKTKTILRIAKGEKEKLEDKLENFVEAFYTPKQKE